MRTGIADHDVDKAVAIHQLFEEDPHIEHNDRDGHHGKVPRAARCITERDEARHYMPPLPSRMPMPYVTAPSTAPTTVISKPDDHQERTVMRLLAAPTAKCAASETTAAAMTAGTPCRKKNGMIGNQRANGRGQGAGARRDDGIRQRFFRCAEALAGQRAQQLFRIAGDVVDHVKRVRLGQAL